MYPQKRKQICVLTPILGMSSRLPGAVFVNFGLPACVWFSDLRRKKFGLRKPSYCVVTRNRAVRPFRKSNLRKISLAFRFRCSPRVHSSGSHRQFREKGLMGKYLGNYMSSTQALPRKLLRCGVADFWCAPPDPLSCLKQSCGVA